MIPTPTTTASITTVESKPPGAVGLGVEVVVVEVVSVVVVVIDGSDTVTELTC